MKMSRIMPVLILASLLTACGFTLRGYGESFELPPALQTLTVDASNPGNDVARELRSQLRASGVTLADEATEGIYEVSVGNERVRERIISLDSGARAGEYAISMVVSFRLLDGATTLLGPEDISLERSYQADPENAIAKAEEADLIQEEMRRAIAAQIIARLQNFGGQAGAAL